MANKDSECLEGLKDWDVIILSETWMNKGNEKRQETCCRNLLWVGSTMGGTKKQEGKSNGRKNTGMKTGIKIKEDKKDLSREEIVTIKVKLVVVEGRGSVYEVRT